MNEDFTKATIGGGHPIRRMVSARRSDAPAARQPAADDNDIKLFALSFTAFFICIYTLIF